jgi:hypothetical protein
LEKARLDMEAGEGRFVLETTRSKNNCGGGMRFVHHTSLHMRSNPVEVLLAFEQGLGI